MIEITFVNSWASCTSMFSGKHLKWAVSIAVLLSACVFVNHRAGAERGELYRLGRLGQLRKSQLNSQHLYNKPLMVFHDLITSFNFIVPFLRWPPSSFSSCHHHHPHYHHCYYHHRYHHHHHHLYHITTTLSLSHHYHTIIFTITTTTTAFS